MQTFISESIEVYIHNEAKQGNNECGDTYYIHADDKCVMIAIADGLGSGLEARRAAQVIPDILERFPEESFEDLFSHFSREMTHKRGAVVALVRISFESNTIEHSSLGNIRFYLLRRNGQIVYPLPKMGYVSTKRTKIKIDEYPIGSGDLFLLHSDGVTIKSPRALLTESEDALGIYMNTISSIDNKDDSTFIAGALL